MILVMYIIVGLVAGWVVTEFSPSHRHHQFFSNFVIGAIGALLGGYIFEILGLTSFSLWEGIGSSMLGSFVFLIVVKRLAMVRN